MDPDAAVVAIDYLKTRNAVLESDLALYKQLLQEAADNYQVQAQEIARLRAELNIAKENQ